jgi:transketolase
VETHPSIIIADTIKGKGVSFMEHTQLGLGEPYAFHSGAPSVEQYGQAVLELIEHANRRLARTAQPPLRLLRVHGTPRSAAPKQQRLVDAYAKALVEQGRRNPDLVVLDADLILDCGLIPFREAYPERFFECGIAEQDMVSQASGMAITGLLPIVHSFACFLTARANEQVYNAATEGTKILYVGSLAGLTPGGPGHSHQSVRDISALAAVPGLILIEPATEAEVAVALDFALNATQESVYLRLVSVPCEVPFELPPSHDFALGKGVALSRGEDAVLFGYGPVLLSQAFHASRILADQHGIGLKVFNLPWLNRVDKSWLHAQVRGYSHIFTLDNHYITGGQGDAISGALVESGLPASTSVCRIGIEEVPQCGTDLEVLRAHRLDASSLVRRVTDRLITP